MSNNYILNGLFFNQHKHNTREPHNQRQKNKVSAAYTHGFDPGPLLIHTGNLMQKREKVSVDGTGGLH